MSLQLFQRGNSCLSHVVFWCKPRITTPKFIKLLTLALIVKPNSQWSNWHLPTEIITGDIIYKRNSSVSEFSMCIPLQMFVMTAHGIIPVTQTDRKQRLSNFPCSQICYSWQSWELQDSQVSSQEPKPANKYLVFGMLTWKYKEQ